MADTKNTKPKFAFGVGAEVKDVSFIPFPIEQRFRAYKAGQAPDPFHLCILNDVTARQFVKKKYATLDGVVLGHEEKPTVEQVTPDSISSALDLKFSSPDGAYTYTYTFWEQDPEDAEYNARAERDNQTLARFWGGLFEYGTAQTVLSPANIKEVNGKKDPESYFEYFTVIEKLFKTHNQGKPIYQDGNGKPIIYRIKLVFYEGDVSLPRFDNFIEVVSEQVPSRLSIKKNDVYEASKAGGSAPKIGAKAAGRGAATADDNGGWPKDLD